MGALWEPLGQDEASKKRQDTRIGQSCHCSSSVRADGWADFARTALPFDHVRMPCQYPYAQHRIETSGETPSYLNSVSPSGSKISSAAGLSLLAGGSGAGSGAGLAEGFSGCFLAGSSFSSSESSRLEMSSRYLAASPVSRGTSESESESSGEATAGRGAFSLVSLGFTSLTFFGFTSLGALNFGGSLGVALAAPPTRPWNVGVAAA